MSKASRKLPGIKAYPDLEQAMIVELSRAGCCGAESTVVAKFRERMAKRDKRHKKR